MYICTYTYTYMCVKTYIYVYMYVYIRVTILMYIYVFMYMCIYLNVHTCIYTFTNICMIYMNIYIHYIYIYIYICTYGFTLDYFVNEKNDYSRANFLNPESLLLSSSFFSDYMLDIVSREGIHLFCESCFDYEGRLDSSETYRMCACV